MKGKVGLLSLYNQTSYVASQNSCIPKIALPKKNLQKEKCGVQDGDMSDVVGKTKSLCLNQVHKFRVEFDNQEKLNHSDCQFLPRCKGCLLEKAKIILKYIIQLNIQFRLAKSSSILG